jgi:ABC-type sugar transport system ATPase subunit
MQYGATVALRDVTLTIGHGTIHALVGENGAGKSTFLNIAAGRVRPSAGTIAIYDSQLDLGNPRAARRLGVAAIYQELTLVPAMTAIANVFLGSERSRIGLLDARVMTARYEALQEQLGVRIPAKARIDTLSVADQQVLEIMRGLQEEARLLLFDEPTSSLGRAERERLFATIRRLKDSGVTSVFVSHDLGDVLDLSDVVTVFRDGHIVETRATSSWTRSELVTTMLGGHELVQPTAHAAAPPSAEALATVLSVEHLSLGHKLKDISFSLHHGEILGIGGLVGSGRSTLLRCLAGDAASRADGVITVDGRRGALPRSPASAIKRGIALIPENRRKDGLALNMTALENILLPDFYGFPLAPILRRSGVRRAHDVALRVGFDPGRLTSLAENLSGGNQQKLLLARWVSRKNVRVLLADEPTRGVDVGAKAEILRTLRQLADGGLAIVVVSSEFEELESIADRLIVLAGGEVVAELHRDRGEISGNRILHEAFAARPSTVASAEAGVR